MVQALDNQETCQLLGPISIVIQLFMGIAAITILLLKRNREHPRRKFIVWLYDVGKQVIGALGIHFVNLGISVLKRKGHELINNVDDDDGQCDWYFLNLLLDTTIGVPILWAFFTCLENILLYFNVKNIESGNYFSRMHDDDETADSNAKKPKHTAFLKQLGVFTVALALMKMCTYFILNEFESFAYWLANVILGWSDSWPNFQVFLVMFVFPVLLNCFQYFCVDNIIKLPTNCVSLDNVDNFETDSLDTSEFDQLSSFWASHDTGYKSIPNH